MLALHIGLPKTGTTFLQHRVFATAPDIAFVHRTRGPEAAAICAGLRFLAKAPGWRALARGPGLARRLAAAADAAPGRPLVVSDENVAMRSAGFWTGDGPTPESLARRLALLSRALPARLRPLRVLIGVRGQDVWLASRYAESSKHFPGFGQADFDRRMAAIAAAGPLDGPLGWLDHDRVAAAFAAALGAGNLLILPQERLLRDPDAALGDIGRLIGVARLAADRPGRTNRLGVGGGVWRMRSGGELALAPATSAALRARFGVGGA